MSHFPPPHGNPTHMQHNNQLCSHKSSYMTLINTHPNRCVSIFVYTTKTLLNSHIHPTDRIGEKTTYGDHRFVVFAIKLYRMPTRAKRPTAKRWIIASPVHVTPFYVAVIRNRSRVIGQIRSQRRIGLLMINIRLLPYPRSGLSRKRDLDLDFGCLFRQ